MMTFDHKPSSLLTAVVLTWALGTVTGCAKVDEINNAVYDPRTEHPIQVAREQVAITIALPTQDAMLSPGDERRLRGFIRDFVNRGRTVITVESQDGEAVRALLEAQGLRANEIAVISDTTIQAPNAALSFVANVAKVPDCGDWSNSTAFNPNNNPPPNFGCSNRRNLGLTVADPGDLIDAQPMTGRGAARRDTVIDSYNAGEPIGPETQAIDPQSVSGAAQ